jgi:hypothetical protein
VIGPSVYLARELARVWGNMTYGFQIVADKPNERHLRAYARDLQRNTTPTQDAVFAKLQQRKVGEGKDARTEWVQPNERDLRELTNRQGSTAVRNCILYLIPRDLLDDLREKCDAIVDADIAKDPKGNRKKIVDAFGTIGVPASQLEELLRHSLDQITDPEVKQLRGIFESIRSGDSIWPDYLPSAAPALRESMSVDELREQAAAKKKPPSSPPADDRRELPITPDQLEELRTMESAAVENQWLTIEQIADIRESRGIEDPATTTKAKASTYIKALGQQLDAIRQAKEGKVDDGKGELFDAQPRGEAEQGSGRRGRK